MDRKLFLSYIQNMQQNNQDMIGFQNSIKANSWIAPKPIVEQNFKKEDKKQSSKNKKSS